MGELQQVRGTMPHPAGDIIVALDRKGVKGVEAEITLPKNLKGTFVWEGKGSSIEKWVSKDNIIDGGKTIYCRTNLNGTYV